MKEIIIVQLVVNSIQDPALPYPRLTWNGADTWWPHLTNKVTWVYIFNSVSQIFPSTPSRNIFLSNDPCQTTSKALANIQSNEGTGLTLVLCFILHFGYQERCVDGRWLLRKPTLELGLILYQYIFSTPLENLLQHLSNNRQNSNSSVVGW